MDAKNAKGRLEGENLPQMDADEKSEEFLFLGRNS